AARRPQIDDLQLVFTQSLPQSDVFIDRGDAGGIIPADKQKARQPRALSAISKQGPDGPTTPHRNRSRRLSWGLNSRARSLAASVIDGTYRSSLRIHPAPSQSPQRHRKHSP